MTTPCPHYRKTGSSTPAQVSTVLDAAAARAAADGGRLTAPKRRVLDLLLTASGPVKAYDLVSSFHADGGHAKPATVYRALEYLERMGLVHRLATQKSYVACNHDDCTPVTAFLICECCGSSCELPSPEIATLTAAAAAAGYAIDRFVLELQGRCPRCLDGEAGDSLLPGEFVMPS